MATYLYRDVDVQSQNVPPLAASLASLPVSFPAHDANPTYISLDLSGGAFTLYGNTTYALAVFLACFSTDPLAGDVVNVLVAGQGTGSIPTGLLNLTYVGGFGLYFNQYTVPATFMQQFSSSVPLQPAIFLEASVVQ